MKSKTKSEDPKSPNNVSDNAESERRRDARYETTFLASYAEGDDRVQVRGNITDSGNFFIPEIPSTDDAPLDLAVRLPGVGRWIHCRDAELRPAKRGDTQGVLGNLQCLSEEDEDVVQDWKNLSSKKPSGV